MFTFITLRALSASPLMIGGDLPTMDGFSMRLITDPEMLACNQNGVMGKRISFNDGIDVWKTPEKGSSKDGWAGIFNRTDQIQTFSLTPASIGLEGEVKAVNVWKGQKQYHLSDASPIKIDINPDGVIFLRYE